MANPYIWAGLERANNDPTTIDQAIAEAVVAHDNDPDAHVQPGQSLESHRASEIIDHRAESIVNDKIKANTRAYVAIVDPSTEYDFDTIEAACQYARRVGGGNILVMPGTHYINDIVTIDKTISLTGIDIDNTIVVGNSNARPMFFYKPFNRSLTYGINTASMANGSPDITVDMLETLDYEAVTGYVITQGATTLWATGTIQSFTSPTKIRMSANQTSTKSTSSAVLVPTFGVVTGSKSFVVPVGNSCSKMGIQPGMRFKLGTSNTLYTIMSIADDTTFLVDKNFVDSTGRYPMVVGAPMTGAMTIQNISLKSADRHIFTIISGSYDDAHNETLYLRECSVETNALVSYNESPNWNLERCTFLLKLGFGDEITAEVRATDCIMMANQNGTGFGYFMGQLYLERCSFIANGFTGHTWLAGVEDMSMITNCIFESTAMLSLGDYQGKFIGNTVVMTGTNAMSVSGGQGAFSSNWITRIKFESGSSYHVFVGNITDITPTNSGTNNLLANNVLV